MLREIHETFHIAYPGSRHRDGRGDRELDGVPRAVHPLPHHGNHHRVRRSVLKITPLWKQKQGQFWIPAKIPIGHEFLGQKLPENA